MTEYLIYILLHFSATFSVQNVKKNHLFRKILEQNTKIIAQNDQIDQRNASIEKKLERCLKKIDPTTYLYEQPDGFPIQTVLQFEEFESNEEMQESLVTFFNYIFLHFKLYNSSYLKFYWRAFINDVTLLGGVGERGSRENVT